MFVDQVRINLKGGDGGAGVASFQRQRGKPRGKAVGGSGGNGGDVVLAVDPSMATLLTYARSPHHKAESGTHGQGELRHGRNGKDRELSVPPGTIVRDESGTVIADLVAPGERIVVARGGRGGKGNGAFVSPNHRAPTFAEQGEYGESAWVTLELRLLADAALVGFPNAGKSTLISRVTAAKPKVADYPFTTLQPHLGVVDVDGSEFVLADIPGLIEGAAEGKGLGHEFLRHVERARVLVILLDPSPLQELTFGRQLEVLVSELARHSPGLADRPRLVALNKADLLAGTADARQWAETEHVDLHVISAVTGEGVDGLLYAVAAALDAEDRQLPERQGFVLHRPVAMSFQVSRAGDRWVVAGRDAERAVALADLTAPEAADFAARRLKRLGVDDALRRAGARPGDDVQIGDLVFTFEPDDADHEVSDSAGDDGKDAR